MAGGKGTELATAYITLIPSLRGATKKIESELGGMDTSSAAKKIGSGLGKGIGDNIDLKAAGNKLANFGGKISDVGDKLTSHFTVPLAAATVGAGAFALKTASAAETSEMAFTTMLGSAKAARDMLNTLADFAAKTPFELSGLTTATQQLLAYGFTAEEIIPMLTAVGDATAALGTGQQGIEAVTRALGQMQTRGKVSAEEMLQLTEAGIPAWEYLAEAIGTDTADAMDKVSDGAVKASTGIKAITKGMERDFGGMMEKQSKTVEGLMSNLSDAIEQPLMKLRDSDAYERFADSLAEIVDAAEPFVESLLPHMEKGLDKVSGVLDVAADAMNGFTNMSEESQSELIGLVGQVALLGPALKVLGPAFKTVGSVMSGATSAASLLQGGLAGIAVGAAALVAINIVGWFLDAAEHEKLLNDATMDFDEIMSQAADTASASGDAIAQSFFDAGDAADDVLKSMSDLNEQAVDTLSEISVQSSQLDTYLGVIDELAGKSKLTASEQEKLKQAVKGYNDITGDSVEVTDAASGKLSESTDKLHENADAWIENANAQAYQSLAQQYLEEQLDAQQKLKQAQDELADSQERIANADIWNTGISGLIKLKNEVSENQQAVDDLSDAAKIAGDNYEAFSSQAAISMSGLSDNIKSALSSLPGDMQMAGLDIATSLSAGIESGSVSTDAAMQFINDSIAGTVASLPPTMHDAGMQAAQSLADAVASGQLSVGQAATVLNAAVNGEVANLPSELAPYGEQAAQALGSSMSLNSAVAGTGASSLSSAAESAISSMPSDFGTVGSSAGQSLSKALGSMSSTTGTSAGSLKNAANAAVSSLPSDMGSTGSSAGKKLASGIGSGEGSTKSNAGKLSSAAKSSVSSLPQALNKTGSTASSKFASGIGSGEGATKTSAGKLDSAASKMKSGNSYSWGSDLASNFASGIRSAYSIVSGAASTIANAAAKILHFSVPKDGPWSGSEKGGFTSGIHLGENFANGMMAALPSVRSASLALASASNPYSSVSSYRAGALGSTSAASSGQTINQIYLDGDALNVDGRIASAIVELVSAVERTRGMGVAVNG